MNARVVLVRNADRMMNAISPVEEGIELSFADGCTGVIPFSDIPEIEGPADLDRIELPTPYVAVLWNARGGTAEIPWDFARHYCDPSYRSRIEAVSARGRIALGEQIKRLREDASFTQLVLARSAGISRVTLLRLEKGQILVGQDTDFDTTPSKIGMGWAVRMDKADFVGRTALARITATSMEQKLVRIAFEGPKVPAEGATLHFDGAYIGYLTSCRFSPALGHGGAVGWVRRRNGDFPGTVQADGITGTVVTGPFYDPKGERLRA